MQRPPDAITDIIPPREGEFRIQLPAFEGPLDLLLHLCKKHELDILDLPVSFVTERYLEYLQLMQDLDLDVAAEYLLMAATLAHIKSKMLLPRTPVEQQDDGELGEVTDPRADLIRRLLEYQKYKNAAESLGARAITGRDVFPRGSTAAEAEGPAPLADIGMFKLLDAFEAILKRTKDRSAFEVTSERISIQERMTQISDLLRVRGSCTFEELFEKDVSRYEVVITFLALLEMTKMRLTRIHQAEYGAAIHVQHALLDASAPTIPPEGEGDGASAAESTGAPRGIEPLAAAVALAVEDELDAEADAESLEAEARAEAELEDVTETLEAVAEALEAEAETLEADSDAEALEAIADVLEGEADTLEVEADALEAEASVLEAEAGVLEAEARLLETGADALEVEADVLKAEAGMLDAEAGVLDAVAEVLQADADVLKAEASVLEAEADADADALEPNDGSSEADDDEDDEDDFDDEDDEDDEEDESAS